jgi:SAM-dependent methyltransferase
MEEWSEDDMANTWKDLSFDELVAANRPELMRREAQFGGEENAGRAGSDQSAQSAHWEEFYKRNKEAFFRDRRYLLRDYPELVALVPQVRSRCVLSCFLRLHVLSKNARIAEWGCGVGNALWGLLQERPLFRADAFDCAASAVALVNERRDPRVSCVRWDPSEMQSPSPFAPSSLQCSLFFFFLSALRDRETLVRVARECFLATRPGGIAIVRDYGVYDMTMLRFAGKGGRKVAECVYQRHDGTLTHFFTREEVEAVFCDAGFVCVRSGYEARELRNRKTKEKMYRNW